MCYVMAEKENNMLIKFFDPENLWLGTIFDMFGQDLVELYAFFSLWPTAEAP